MLNMIINDKMFEVKLIDTEIAAATRGTVTHHTCYVTPFLLYID